VRYGKKNVLLPFLTQALESVAEVGAPAVPLVQLYYVTVDGAHVNERRASWTTAVFVGEGTTLVLLLQWAWMSRRCNRASLCTWGASVEPIGVVSSVPRGQVQPKPSRHDFLQSEQHGPVRSRLSGGWWRATINQLGRASGGLIPGLFRPCSRLPNRQKNCGLGTTSRAVLR
jgi:hypothetical protein